MADEHVSAEQLLENLQAVIRDSEALLKATASFAGDKVGEARARAEESLAAAKARLGEAQDDVVGRAREFVDIGQTFVRDKPWQAMGIAAAVGFLLGAVLTRRQS